MIQKNWNALSVLAAFMMLLKTVIIDTAFAQTTAVLSADTITAVGGYKDDGDSVALIVNDDLHVPFKKALHVTRAKVSEISYSAALVWTSMASIKKGDLLTATFYLRNTMPNHQPLNLDVTFQQTVEPYTPTLSTATPVDTLTWQKYNIPFRAVQDYPAEQATLQIRYSLAIQAFDVGGVAVTNYGQVSEPIPKSISNGFAYYYPGRGEAKAAWRTSALAKIAAHRKGEMKVRVVDATGKALPGAALTIEQTKSAFVWATAASAISLVCKVDTDDSLRPCPEPDQLGDKPLTLADYRKLRSLLLEDFNAVSFYNDLKWTEWHGDKQLALDGIAWLKRNKISLARGHNLIWPSFEPDYMMPKEIINRTTKPSEVKRVIAEHFADELGALHGQVPEWDVVNEPFTNTDIQGRIAAPDLKPKNGVLAPSAVATWFKNAHRHDPKALLFLNDFSIFENLNPTAQQYDLALVKYIKGLNAPIDGIGFQGHFGAAGPVFSDMQRSIDQFSPDVKFFSLTEFDFTSIDPKLQADLMEDVMTFIYSQPKFNLFQMWGFWDGDHWLGNAPLYNRDWSLKPSGEVWQRLTKRTWRTQVDGLTDKLGEYKLRAFYGDYRITVKYAGKTCASKAQFNTSGEVVATGSC